MKTFTCSCCGQTLYFENEVCTQCGAALAFVPELGGLVSVVNPQGSDMFSVDGLERKFRHCDNRTRYGACNWAVPVDADEPHCEACRLNELVPDLSIPENRSRWRSLEQAKRRLLWSLRRLSLDYGPDGALPALRFRLLADGPTRPKVFTGHANGVITINLAEAHAPAREAARLHLGESYRTPLGHFRHESGHYFWDRLIAPQQDRLEAFRQVFGDEREDYEKALQRHYEDSPDGAPAGYISSYAASHPWEDWAESWAHYLHMLDGLETAAEYHSLEVVPYQTAPRSFSDMVVQWQKLSIFMNSISRSMGMSDPYPFAPPESAINKLAFVHEVVTNAIDHRSVAAAS